MLKPAVFQCSDLSKDKCSCGSLLSECSYLCTSNPELHFSCLY